MAVEQDEINTVAPLRNVVKLQTLVERVTGRADALPGMAVFYGPAGFGKSMAGVYAALKHNAVTVQVKSVWGKKQLVEAVAREIGVVPKGNTPDLLDRVCMSLVMSNRPLLIDEADYLVQRKMIEIVRDIYEGSGAPIILIGEELMPQKLRAWERVHARILEWVAAEPANMADLNHLARLYAPGIEVADELKDRFLQTSQGSARRLAVNLDRLRELAMVRGCRRIGLAEWGSEPIYTGAAPEIRQFDRRAG